MGVRLLFVVGACRAAGSLGQLVDGGQIKNSPPPLGISRCTKDDGCELEVGRATLDASWRWVHAQNCQTYGQCDSVDNCFSDDGWNPQYCPDPKECAANCLVEGVDKDHYITDYGVSLVPGGLKMQYTSQSGNTGSRLFFLDSPTTYKHFKLKNRELAFDVDASTMPCGVNGALFLAEMPKDGGADNSAEGDVAGAAHGLGYCDSKCSRDLKFLQSLGANSEDWNKTDGVGKFGACCSTMNIWEANSESSAFSSHPCDQPGSQTCSGSKLKCGSADSAERYESVCDWDGCDFNSYGLGAKEFYGKEKGVTVDSSRPITVVTQFITSDGTDQGDLAEIRRLYVQDDKVIANTNATMLEGEGCNSITEDFCQKSKDKFGLPNKHKEKGGLKKLGEAMDRGMVLVMSLRDDSHGHMSWLDSDFTQGGKLFARGPCPSDSGDPEKTKQANPDAHVKFFNIMYGEIDSTYTAGYAAKPEAIEKSYDPSQAQSSQQAPAEAPQEQQQEEVPADQEVEEMEQKAKAEAEQREEERMREDISSEFSSGDEPKEDTTKSPSSEDAGDDEGPLVAAYAQCGGQGYSGPTRCQGKCKCANMGDWAQCEPPEGEWTCEPDEFSQKFELGRAVAPIRREPAARLGPMALGAALALAVGAVACRVHRRASAPHELEVEETPHGGAGAAASLLEEVA